MSEHEVKTKLTLDDHASHTLEHIKEGFEHVEEKATEVGHEIGDVFKTALGTALGFQAMGMIETFKEMGSEVMHAAAGLEEQEKAIRGVLMITDKEGTSLEEMTSHAHELNEEFATMGIETGQTKESLVHAFDEMAERTGMATEDVVKLTDVMSEAGRAIPGGIDSLSTGFSNMSAGMIRAKNPVVQLIAATGLLHGNAKAVAKQLQAMSPEKAMQLGISAVQKMGEKMKGVPLTFNETVTSLKGLREEIYESLGAPMLKALGGPLNELRDYFTTNREEINKWAQTVGHDAGEWLKSAAEDMKDGFKYLQTHAFEIKYDIKEAMTFVRDTVKFLIDHREAIALAWGVSKLPAAAGMAMSGAKMIGGAGSAVLGLGGKMAGMGAAGAAEGAAGAGAAEGAVGAAGAAGIGASIAALAAFAAAAAAVGIAVDQAAKLWNELPNSHRQAEAYIRQMEAAATEGNTAYASALRDNILALGDVTQSEIARATSLRDIAAQTAQIATIDRSRTDNALNVADNMTQAGKGKGAAQAAAQMFMGELDVAIKGQDQATLTHMAAFLATHDGLLAAMHSAGVDLTKEGSFLVGALEGLGKKSEAAEIRGILAQQLKKSGEITAAPVMNFTGPIHIQQDFKNMDPDRIALIFKKSLAKSAQAKTTAATQSPHTAF